jgi:hypothetical protein
MHSARTAGLKTTGLSQRQAEDLAGTFHGLDGLRYVELSGQTGPNAAPMHPSWAREIRDECQAAAVPFRFESWGEWSPYTGREIEKHCPYGEFHKDGQWFDCCLCEEGQPGCEMYRVGRRKSGSTLDGVTHDDRIEFNQQKGDR